MEALLKILLLLVLLQISTAKSLPPGNLVGLSIRSKKSMGDTKVEMDVESRL